MKEALIKDQSISSQEAQKRAETDVKVGSKRPLLTEETKDGASPTKRRKIDLQSETDLQESNELNFLVEPHHADSTSNKVERMERSAPNEDAQSELN